VGEILKLRKMIWGYHCNYIIRRAVKKFSEMWYSTEMIGHMTTVT